MRTGAILLAVLIALCAVAANPACAETAQRCIYLYPAQLSNLHSASCNSNPSWAPFISLWVGCEDPSAPVSELQHCDNAPNGVEQSQWLLENHPANSGSSTWMCSPWSGSFSECDPGPTPNDCRYPTNAAANCIGDPVDLTTGTLEQRATDLDLGGGLVFERFYASNAKAVPAGAMGSRWRHGLDWSLHHRQLIGQGSSTSPLVEAVVVKRPFGTSVPFVRETWAAPVGAEAWQGGANGAGGLTGDPTNGGFVYADDDGTRVAFAAETFEVTEIQPPGEPAIAVTHVGDVTTYTRGGASLAVTMQSGKVQSVVGAGQTWTYGYGAGDCLTSVTGPNPAAPSETVQWTYTYVTNGQATCQLTALHRQLGAGSPVEIASWTYANGKVSSASEPGLDQTLHLTYSTAGANNVTTVRDQAGTTAPALASFTTQDGRILSTTADGGPGIEVPLRTATFTDATSAGAPRNLWKTTTDLNGAVTLYEGHDSRGRPARIVEGWIDSNTNGAFDPTDGHIRRREYLYHPALDEPIAITEKSSITGVFDRVTIHDYDASPAACTQPVSAHNMAPTDRLRRTCVLGSTLDASGAVVPFVDQTDYAYDGAGRMTDITGPRAAEYAKLFYDATSGSRSALRRYLNGANSAYLEWTFSNFDARGNPQTVTDPNLRVTSFTYDTLGRVLTAKPPCEAAPCTGANDTTVTFTYDIDGNLTKVQFPDDSTGADVFLEMGYDAAKPDQLRFLKDAQGNAIVYTYVKGRVTREERYTGFTSLASPGTRVGDTTFSYNAAGRLLEAFNPLFAAGDVFSEFAHDPKGNPTGVTDENGRHDDLAYDALDRLLSISQVRALTYTTTFAYDALSNVTEVTDAAGKTTDLLHDDRGHLVETVSPDTGRTRFVYDAAGNLTQKIENAPATGAGGRTTSYTYDGLNRLTAIDLPNDPDWAFSYDTDAAKNQKGRLAEVTNGTVTTRLEYTRRGDVAVERTVVDGLSHAVTYAYDAAGNRVSVTTPDGTQASLEYAGLRPSKLMAGAANTFQTIEEIQWHPFGPRLHAAFPPYDYAAGANVVSSDRTVNLRGQVTAVSVTGPPTEPEGPPAAFVDRAYGYDETAGAPLPNDPGPNLDTMSDAVSPDESRTYFYDALDRLARVADATGAATLHAFSYDAVGNRTSKTGPLGASTYAYETNSDRLDAATGDEARDYHHDVYGNRDYDGESAYTGTPSLLYDDANRLVTVKDPANGFATLATYTYDAFGRRVKKVAAGKTLLFFYDTEGHLIAEIEKVAGASNDLSRTYVFLEDELVGVVDRVEEVGSAALLPALALRLPAPGSPVWAVLLAVIASGGLVLVARRQPAWAATATGTALAVFLCAGTNRPPPVYTWVHTDPLGTPLAVTSAPFGSVVPTVIWRASYEPFGKADPDSDPDANGAHFTLNVRFPGQYADAERGYSYNMFRTMDPTTGRFIEPDPIGLEGGLNLYAYAESDPVNRADPLGLATFLCRKPLDALGGSQPGSGTRSGPEVPWNPLYHQFICVARPGGITCGGQTAAGSGFTHLFNEGLPSDDTFDPNRCEPVDKSDSCFENCLLATFSGERPFYGLAGPGTNCQEWSEDALAFCRRLCDNRERAQ